MEMKWFATNVEDAEKWGIRFQDFDLRALGYYYNNKIVEVTVPTESLKGMMYKPGKYDGIGPAYCTTSGYINSVKLDTKTVR